MLQREIRRELSHGGLGKEERGADPQTAARRVTAGCDGGRRLFEIGQQRAGSLEKRATLFGQFQGATAALEQAQVQARLQLRDPARQRRLGAAARPSGAAEAFVSGDEVEVGKGKEIHLFHL